MSPYSENNRGPWGAIVVVLAVMIFVAIICGYVVHWPCQPFCPPPTSTPTQGGSSTNTPPSPTPETPSLTAPPPGTIIITIYSSDTKEDWINTVTESFNAAQFKTSLGNIIFVIVTHGNSGDPVKMIPAGELTPTIWSPGEQSWVYDLNEIWDGLHGQPLITEACRPTVYAPVGFAMFRPMAEAMGWPDTPIGWKDIIALMEDPQGWGRYGRPDWGQFKFGHTHPDRSNSGLLLLTALAYSMANKTGDLTLQDVKSGAYEDAMRIVELHTYHYGIKSRDNVVRMIQKGPEFLHATNTSEAETLRANSGIYGTPHFPLAFIFPADGTFWAEQPFCVLDAGWVSADQREAAWLYYDYLLEPAQQALTVKNYLRPVDTTIPLTVTLENGTDPGVTPQTVPALASVLPEVSRGVRDVFHQTKRKLTVVLVLDTSKSMQGNKIAAAAEAAAQLVESDDLEPDDEIYTYLFGSSVVELLPSGRASDVKDELPQKLRTVIAEGGTALYDAVCEAAKRVTTLRAEDEAAGDSRLYGIVVLTDGEDTNSKNTKNDVFSICLPSGEEAQGIRVFTIVYGEDANQKGVACNTEGADKAMDFLISLANRTDGKCYTANPDNIQEILPGILVQ
jgi:Ca-activated chloride channel family protein